MTAPNETSDDDQQPGTRLVVYRYKLRPRPTQVALLNAQCETLRRLYNRALSARIAAYDADESRITLNDLKKMFITAPRHDPTRPEHAYLHRVSVSTAQQCLIVLDKAYQAYFRAMRDYKAGKRDDLAPAFARFASDMQAFEEGRRRSKPLPPCHPRFKRAGQWETISFNAIGHSCRLNWAVITTHSVDGADVPIVKMHGAERVKKGLVGGVPLPHRWTRAFVTIQHVGSIRLDANRYRDLPDGAEVRNLSITRRASGWYVQILLRIPDDRPVPNEQPDRIVALLPSLKPMCYVKPVAGMVRKLPAPMFYMRAEAGLASRQRRVSRRGLYLIGPDGEPRRDQGGQPIIVASRGQLEARRLVARYHERIKNARQLWHRTLARRLVTEYDLIIRQRLRIRGNVRKPQARPDSANPLHWYHNEAGAVARLNKRILDNAWSALYAEMDRAALETGCRIIDVSGIDWISCCSRCGAQGVNTSGDLILAIRCAACGAGYSVHNTMCNLTVEGLKLLTAGEE